MSPERYVLAIDLGTSGPKVGVVSTGGSVESWAFEPVSLHLGADGAAEQDPDDWWRALATASRTALEHAAVDRAMIEAVSCTGQWSGTVPVGPSGSALGRALIWMDTRGAPLIEELIGGPVRIDGYDVRKAARWIRLTGGAPGKAGKDPVAHILWLERHRPEIARDVAVYLEPVDYLGYRLTGRAAAPYHSMALHWVTDNRDPTGIRYDDGLLDLAGLDRSRLPDLVPPATVLGPLRNEQASELGLLAGTPVVVGAPDLHTAAIGSGGVADGQAHLYLGTSSWLVCHVPAKKTDLLHNIAALPAALPGRRLLANEQETAGACLTWLAESIGLIPADHDPGGESVYQAYDRAAERVPPGANGVLFTPWLVGERTPVENAAIRSGFHHQSLATTGDDLVRAVLEGVALNSRWLLGYVEKFVGHRLDGIRMVGGGAGSDIWCRIHADVLQRTVRRVADPILVNLRGAGLLAAVAIGAVAPGDLADRVEITATLQPDPAAAAVYDRQFDRFVRTYRSGKRLAAR